MVWQEFILSSSGIDSSPPADPDYIAMLTAEAEQIIPRRRNHASLALWCGGNELQGRPGMASAADVERGQEQPLDDGHPALAGLKAVVKRLDPDRLWLPTSPTGRAFGNSLGNIEADPLGQHDVHGPWEYQGVTKHYTLYNAGTSLFHSEFGVEGITNPQSLNTVISPEHQWSIDLAQNPYWFHLGAWWVRRVVWDETFGALPDVATYVRATQFTQADGLRYAVEADRRRQWRNSGTIPWQFNEPYPMAACTSAVDYWAEPKPVYFAVARAYEPLTVTAAFPAIAWAGRESFTAEIWVNAALGLKSQADMLRARLIAASGRIYTEQTRPVACVPNAATRLANIQYPISDLTEDIFLLDLRLIDPSGATVAANRYVFTRTGNLAALIAPQPQTRLAVEVRDGLSPRLPLLPEEMLMPGAAPRRLKPLPQPLPYEGRGATQFPLPSQGGGQGVGGRLSGQRAGVRVADAWDVTVANSGNHTAFFVWLADARPRGGIGWAYFDDNYFCLFPGERRTVAVTWRDVPEAERALEIQGWNTGRMTLSAHGAI